MNVRDLESRVSLILLKTGENEDITPYARCDRALQRTIDRWDNIVTRILLDHATRSYLDSPWTRWARKTLSTLGPDGRRTIGQSHWRSAVDI